MEDNPYSITVIMNPRLPWNDCHFAGNKLYVGNGAWIDSKFSCAKEQVLRDIKQMFADERKRMGISS